jgi:hypothetical protein
MLSEYNTVSYVTIQNLDLKQSNARGFQIACGDTNNK